MPPSRAAGRALAISACLVPHAFIGRLIGRSRSRCTRTDWKNPRLPSAGAFSTRLCSARRPKRARLARRDCQMSGSFVRCALTGSTPMRLALVFLLAAAAPAFAQSSKSDPPAADFKPLVQPLVQPLLLPLLPNSYILPGAITADPITPYSSTPGYDAARSGPAPGLRLTIPTR